MSSGLVANFDEYPSAFSVCDASELRLPFQVSVVIGDLRWESWSFGSLKYFRLFYQPDWSFSSNIWPRNFSICFFGRCWSCPFPCLFRFVFSFFVLCDLVSRMPLLIHHKLVNIGTFFTTGGVESLDFLDVITISTVQMCNAFRYQDSAPEVF